ncbi:hypothetical protein Vadar_024498 [Vaccinium darrowii]|uniref:Uncharacterized protein n=1 Tax=Vaccinium darrowii TaxID=229202 RepID=A0ACB7XU28_9ERIC|nr:hypothetical protein Vadar_024498 [Vaccinium darrowii]
MIVAILLATISFAASFTIPGGYLQEDADEGMAILVRDAAFKAFVIANTIAVMCSTSFVFLHLSASLFKFGYEGEEKVKCRYLMVLGFVIIVLAMTIAFITVSLLQESNQDLVAFFVEKSSKMQIIIDF